MVEVKNKLNITKEDVTKYYSDLENYDMGMFISLKTNAIPSYGKFGISYKNGK